VGTKTILMIYSLSITKTNNSSREPLFMCNYIKNSGKVLTFHDEILNILIILNKFIIICNFTFT
jgi:hypothetical protein